MLHHNNHYAGLQKIKEGVLLVYVEFSSIKVTVRYIQYIPGSIYSFNRDDADCVGRLIHLALEDDIH